MEDVLLRDVSLLALEIRLTWLVVLIYIFSLVVTVKGLAAPGSWADRMGAKPLMVGAALHTFLIAFRAWEGRRPPYQSLYEALGWFAWSGVIAYLFVHKKWPRVHAPSLLVTGMAGGAMLFALFRRDPAISPLSPALQSDWFIYHVITAFLSYSLLMVSCAVEISYLFLRPSVRRGGGVHFGLDEGSLQSFRRLAHQLARLGFVLLGFAIISGATWADDAWGRVWSWDPKETWSLITFVIFMIYLHAMTVPRWRGNVASFFNILGFVSMVMTFLGINWLAKLFGIQSLHIYAV